MQSYSWVTNSILPEAGFAIVGGELTLIEGFVLI